MEKPDELHPSRIEGKKELHRANPEPNPPEWIFPLPGDPKALLSTVFLILNNRTESPKKHVSPRISRGFEP